MSGQLNLVSVGPGSSELIAPLAKAALERSDAVVGYGLYLRWIAPWLKGKEIHDLPLTKERERAALALQLARSGRVVSLVSSGDIGVYGLAPLAFEMLEPGEQTDVQVIPGITAAQSCASLLGAPLGHDFATLSLSDLLCPWPWIEQRAQMLARAEVALVLYNVQSEARQEGVYRILDILLAHRPADAWCGIVRNAYREDASSEICTLGELRHKRFDMLTSLVIGTRFTRRNGAFLYAPRGYHGWQKEAAPLPEGIPQGALWCFTGTRDGNALAAQCQKAGHPVVISVATEYGAAQARRHCPGAHIVTGHIGEAARRVLLEASRARAVLDATHPFATRISEQLQRLCTDLAIPCLRYERPGAPLPPEVVACADMEEAGRRAVELGRRIFVGTGVKDLPGLLQTPGGGERQWFARVTPNPESLERAALAGIPASRICAMQGPFSQRANEALWQDWEIDCVLSKDSGEAGGLPAKIAAAKSLGIPLLVVKRPACNNPLHTSDPSVVLKWVESPTLFKPSSPSSFSS
jgi:precorrin-6x reductase